MKFPESCRVNFAGLQHMRSSPGDPCGIFIIRYQSDNLACIATNGDGEEPLWEHVSVTVKNRKMVTLPRCATWEQMCFVKNQFWHESEVVIQYHPAKADYISFHLFCLHLWRPVGVELPQPPTHYIGPQ